MKKYIILVILALSVVLQGCAIKYNDITEQTEYEIVSQVKEYLTEKYGSFYYEINGFFRAGWDQEYDLLNLSVEMDGIKENFSVQRYKTESGYVFGDNYFGLVIRPSFEQKVSEFASQYFDEYGVYATLEQNYPDKLTQATQIHELLELDNLQNISIVVVVEEEFRSVEEFEKVAKSFVYQWTQEGVPSTVRVIYLSEEVFKTIDRSNVSSVFVNNQLAEYREIVK